MNLLPRRSFTTHKRAALAQNISSTQLGFTRCFAVAADTTKVSTTTLSSMFGGNNGGKGSGNAQGNDIRHKIKPPVRLYSKTGVYASTLYSDVVSEALKSEPGVIDTVTSDLEEFAELIHDPDVALELSNPSVQASSLKNFVQQVATKAAFQPISTKFLSELAVQKQLNLVSGIVQDYNKLVNTLLRRYTVEVTVADEDTVPDKEELIELFGLPQDADITYDITVDDSIISGYIASTDEQYVDRSLSTKVAALIKALNAAKNARVDKEWAAMKEDLEKP